MAVGHCGACRACSLNLPCHSFTWPQTLALHLIEGVIDQVDGSVQVSWVQPRILTLPQVRAVGWLADARHEVAF